MWPELFLKRYHGKMDIHPQNVELHLKAHCQGHFCTTWSTGSVKQVTRAMA